MGNKLTLAVMMSFIFMLIGIASIFVKAEKHFTVIERHYSLHDDTLLTQKFRPIYRRIEFSWKNPLTTQEQAR